jgi:hypothetical protein
LDSDIFVHRRGLLCCSELYSGDRVEFEIGSDERNQCTAVNVTVLPRHVGTVVAVERLKYGRFEGIIEFDGREFPFRFDDAVPDKIGRRHFVVGGPVSFYLVGEDSERLADVKSEDPSLDEIADDYREFGPVFFWDRNRGRIKRPDGSSISFLSKNVLDDTSKIAQGVFLAYGIKVELFSFDREREIFWHRVFATDLVQQFPPESAEAHFENAPEMPLAEPQPNPGECFTAQERKMSLREIISARNKTAA